MRDNRVTMPTSTAGITRYFDEYHSKITLKPSHVIIIGVLVLVIEIILHWQGSSLLGI